MTTVIDSDHDLCETRTLPADHLAPARTKAHPHLGGKIGAAFCTCAVFPDRALDAMADILRDKGTDVVVETVVTHR